VLVLLGDLWLELLIVLALQVGGQVGLHRSPAARMSPDV
jgi:hypothetical protein